MKIPNANNTSRPVILLAPDEVRARFEAQRQDGETTRAMLARLGISKSAYYRYVERGVRAEVSESARMVLEME